MDKAQQTTFKNIVINQFYNRYFHSKNKIGSVQYSDCVKTFCPCRTSVR